MVAFVVVEVVSGSKYEKAHPPNSRMILQNAPPKREKTRPDRYHTADKNAGKKPATILLNDKTREKFQKTASSEKVARALD